MRRLTPDGREPRRCPVLRAAPVLALALALLAPPAARADEEALTEAQREVVKPIKVLISSIRYSKDDKASEILAHAEMAQELLKDTWKTMSEAQRKEFQ